MILPTLPHGASRLARQFAEQAKLAFAKLETALAAAGAKPADLVKLNHYVVGLNHEKLVTLREVRDRVMHKDRPPPSTPAGVQALFRDDVQLEIVGSAKKRQRRVPQADFWPASSGSWTFVIRQEKSKH